MMLDDLTFFTQCYPLISLEISRVSSAGRMLKTDADNMRAREILVPAACRMLQLAYTVCGVAAPISEDNNILTFVTNAERLGQIIGDLPLEAARSWAAMLEVHTQYFRMHRPVVERKPSGASDYPIIRDVALNVVGVLCSTLFDHYRWQCPDPREERRFFDTGIAEKIASTETLALIKTNASDLAGWCSYEKAMMLYALVREFKPEKAVEIGIYGGRSIVPVALAMKENKTGEVFGIETWSGATASNFRTSIKNNFAWAMADFVDVKSKFFDYIVRHNLCDVIRVIEARSDLAYLLFDRIDFIHIDGGHSCSVAAQDITNYVSKVPPGGTIVFDDIDWATTGPGLAILMDSCRLLHVVGSIDKPEVPGCAAFVKL